MCGGACAGGAVGLDASDSGESSQVAGGSVPVYQGFVAVEQDRPARPGSGCPVDGPADGWRQRDQHDLSALAAHAQDPVAVFVADVGAGGLEDSQAEQAEHGNYGEVSRIR
jgi:hypothetical protein